MFTRVVMTDFFSNEAYLEAFLFNSDFLFNIQVFVWSVMQEESIHTSVPKL